MKLTSYKRFEQLKWKGTTRSLAKDTLATYFANFAPNAPSHAFDWILNDAAVRARYYDFLKSSTSSLAPFLRRLALAIPSQHASRKDQALYPLGALYDQMPHLTLRRIEAAERRDADLSKQLANGYAIAVFHARNKTRPLSSPLLSQSPSYYLLFDEKSLSGISQYWTFGDDPNCELGLTLDENAFATNQVTTRRTKTYYRFLSALNLIALSLEHALKQPNTRQAIDARAIRHYLRKGFQRNRSFMPQALDDAIREGMPADEISFMIDGKDRKLILWPTWEAIMAAQAPGALDKLFQVPQNSLAPSAS